MYYSFKIVVCVVFVMTSFNGVVHSQDSDNTTVGVVLDEEVPPTDNGSNNTTTNNSNNNNTDTIDDLFNNGNSTTTNGGGNEESNVTLFDGCDVDEYYTSLSSDVTTWTIDAVESLISKTHVNVLPSISQKASEEDIIDALVDVDAGINTSDTVYLYMRHVEFDANQVNIPEGWKRGDLWPLSRNAGLTTPAGTDVHSKRPEDWIVQSELSELFWGSCGTVRSTDQCITPAIPNLTDTTTARDDQIKTPPVRMRGIIARSVLYTALRYRTELDLFLSDCPPFNTSEYGYLSELLTWHSKYPVTDAELVRNNRVCQRWQGNRNPFVDYPELVEQFYGTPDVINNETMTYSACTDPTAPPTATPNECASLDAGDINALIINTDPIDQIVFFPVSDIDESIGTIYVTDRAWNGTQFVTNEGTLEYSIPPGGIKAGRVFGYGVQFPDDKGTWEQSSTSDDNTQATTFDLSSTQSDNLFIYCMNADGIPHFLQAIVYTTGTNTTTDDTTVVPGFVPSGLTSYEYTETSLPKDLTNSDNGVLVLPFHANYLYNGPKEGNKEELLSAFADPANYAGSATPYNINTSGGASINSFFQSIAISIVLVILTIVNVV